MKRIYKLSIAFTFLMSGIMVHGQDAHLSQYASSPILLNPALTGIIEGGDLRIGANYRTQWGSIAASSYTTTGLSFDTKYGSRWGVGGYATNNNLSGFINAFNFMLSGSYQITDPTQNKYRITTGLQAGIMLKQISAKDLVFDNQYEDGNFDPDNQSGEVFNAQSNLLPDFNWGISYIHTDDSWKVKPYLGVSVYHLSLPTESFTESDSDKMPIRWVSNGGVRYEVNPKLLINVRGLYMLQRKAQEINFGVLAHYKINESGYTIIAGTDARWEDAAIIHLGLNHKNITYRISYDVTTSALNNPARGRGGTELSIVYTPSIDRSMPSIR